MTRVMTIVGARPQFVKAAMVGRALAKRPGVVDILVHTGQHADAIMSDVFLSELGSPHPTHRLNVHGGGHGDMTGRMLQALEPVMAAERPDVVVVHGDTNSTLAGALCAAKLRVPVAHVEAGLRSFDRTMPEEVNRVVVDHLSTLLFAPTSTAVANLAREGLASGVHLVGDVMLDATLLLKDLARRTSTLVSDLGLEAGSFVLATLHREATTASAEALSRALDHLRGLAAPGRPVVLPLHPRTRAAAARHALGFDGLMAIDPVGPVDMHALLDGCALVATDSGGLQKEACFHRRRCITLRDSTEWPETVEAGWNRLWTSPDFSGPPGPVPDYGDGDAAGRIARRVLDAVG